MDERTRRTYEILDRRAEHEAEHQAWLDRHAERIANEEVDALLAKLAARRELQTRAAEMPLVFKVHEAARIEPQPQPADDDDIFSPAQTEAVAMFVCEYIGTRLKQASTAVNDQLAQLRDDVATLRDQVEQLAGDLAELRNEISDIQAERSMSNVVLKLKGGRNASAA